MKPMLKIVGARGASLKTKPISQAELLRRYIERQTTRYGHEKYRANPCLFRKCDVTVGTLLKNIARRHGDDGAYWLVTRITTYAKQAKTTKSVQVVLALSDIVQIINTKTREVHSVRFGSMSYSATWWLASDAETAAHGKEAVREQADQ